MGSVFGTGFGMGLTLIVAIGAQNAFVLRQGLRGEHVLAVCLCCALSDAILISAGVAGFGALVERLSCLEPVLRYGGAAFLIWYAAKSLRSALYSTEALTLDPTAARAPLGQVLATALMLTWANPHVYLDTVVFLGSISTAFPQDKISFAAGAICASFSFFFALGFGARWLRPLFAKPLAWRILEGAIALLMALIAVKLVWI